LNLIAILTKKIFVTDILKQKVLSTGTVGAGKRGAIYIADIKFHVIVGVGGMPPGKFSSYKHF